MNMIEKLGLAALHRVNPEVAHDISIRVLAAGLVPLPGRPVTSERLRLDLAGLQLANPIGLAAGYDKNARAVSSLMRAGFGFIELGAATPRPQPGNPKPRLFRLRQEHAIINRFGFNNDGAEAITARLGVRDHIIPVGLNIGANKDSADRSADFEEVVRVAGIASDFLTVNVSSPNTERLRDLQGADALAALLDRVILARDALPNWRPVFVKIAPDLDNKALADIAAVARQAQIDGIIATNTTLSRDGVQNGQNSETGGLSGAPLFQRATHVLAKLYRETRGEIPLIGVGGIGSIDQAWEKLRAGATAIQLYSALIYQGFSLVPKIAKGLDARLAQENMTLTELRGSGVSDWV
ncbi:quinone-dependent dihydroorotate dehydrogenase [Paracoccus sp. R12_1]|uniref:quinone-dependent dihydroorotate dehydrogenase n=1 Tax=unclassified Paracoccus (in: a-proteobacteria) TaxID=2688777 RepID=UPI001ADA1835|nr:MULTISPECIES: quinone-dependent dihydroorotate dehydrogenase [unclassified Paracoccus (in: a-proteobacteria)]MBO9455898.1 quinone-dependent dihydroorotate dehydrogenase [Paracoccus sp. R12_2]MBO9486686.1 quinone-dependent dihydroorotate dehydrogenase [Paracoccus sp. R12_1]